MALSVAVSISSGEWQEESCYSALGLNAAVKKANVLLLQDACTSRDACSTSK